MFDLQKIKGAALEEVLGQMPAAAVIAEAPSGKIILVNEQARQMLEQNLGRSMPSEAGFFGDLRVFHLDGRPCELEELPLMRSIGTGEEVRDEEYTYLLADGTGLRLRCSSSPIYDDEGRIVAGVLIVHDITEQKRAEETQARYATVLEATPDFVGTADAGGHVLSVNRAGRRMIGIGEEEDVSSTRIPDYYPEWAREVVLEQGIPAAVRDGAWSTETAFVSRDGREIPISQVILAHKGQSGEVQYLSTIARDITDRKRAEEALRESSRLIEDILERITEDFFSVDREWRFTYLNERALGTVQSIRGEELTREELLGKNVWEVLPEHVGSTFYHKYHEALREQKTVDFETYSSLSERWLGVHAYPSEEGLSVYDQDITERKRAEERLQEANRRLEELAVLKADFTAMVAHELDTPLAVIGGYAEMLAAGKLEPPGSSHALDKIRSEIGVLKALVADVRAAATVERESFAVEPRHAPVGVLLQNAAGFAATLPGDHPLTVENAAEEEQVLADPDRIGQVLRNLLSNAAKYSPDGAPIVLRAKPLKTGVRIEVADQGTGIHPDDVSRVFEKFGRGRDRSGRKTAGAGLGLYLSRRIMLAHGGDLTLKTVPGGGCVFGFELESAR